MGFGAPHNYYHSSFGLIKRITFKLVKCVVKDIDKTKGQLIDELNEMCGKVAELSASETRLRETEGTLKQSKEQLQIVGS